jgi:hypothetical protein
LKVVFSFICAVLLHNFISLLICCFAEIVFLIVGLFYERIVLLFIVGVYSLILSSIINLLFSILITFMMAQVKIHYCLSISMNGNLLTSLILIKKYCILLIIMIWSILKYHNIKKIFIKNYKNLKNTRLFFLRTHKNIAKSKQITRKVSYDMALCCSTLKKLLINKLILI